MHCFYIEKGQIEEETIRITGDDVNHIKNVLRMSLGENLILCDKEGLFYKVSISVMDESEILADVLEIKKADTELPTKIYLFQGLPKKDKMELIIQKSVELGVTEVIPVATKFCVAKIEDKKKEKKKLERWQSISEAAAKQSGRGIIPKIQGVMDFKEAINLAKKMENGIIPYEGSQGMKTSGEAIKKMAEGKTAAVFIGPEGGFSEEEIAYALEAGIVPITLGKRILRTETAGITALSLLMFEMERRYEEKG
ncbi:MAG: 16S rRNA (uracil(1498)-N(3))-methyltransferase [Acetivibrio sp.]